MRGPPNLHSLLNHDLPLFDQDHGKLYLYNYLLIASGFGTSAPLHWPWHPSVLAALSHLGPYDVEHSCLTW